MNRPKSLPVGTCPICGEEKGLVRDHSYANGLCRDWICTGCNVRLGVYENPLKPTQAIIDYSERWKARHEANGGEIWKAEPRTEEARERNRTAARDYKRRKRSAAKALLPPTRTATITAAHSDPDQIDSTVGSSLTWTVGTVATHRHHPATPRKSRQPSSRLLRNIDFVEINFSPSTWSRICESIEKCPR